MAVFNPPATGRICPPADRESLNVGGSILFCSICKAIRTSRLLVANLTNLNFNVLFEVGYAIGLGKPVLPVRDVSFDKEEAVWSELGIFDTLGYETFENSGQLASIATKNGSKVQEAISVLPQLNRKQPIYYIKSPLDTDGSVKLFSCLKKSYFRFRTFDPRETPRLSLHEAHKQVFSSLGVVAHLLDTNRKGALVHNARCAFVSGMAMAAGKHVLMLQEGHIVQPIDYRDVVQPYFEVSQIPRLVEGLVRATADTLQSGSDASAIVLTGILEQIDLGDVAAENEIQSLANYFVKTPQFQQAVQGHARLVVGRKGSGKTALFYGIRNAVGYRKRGLLLDLKPEGHQLVKLREGVVEKLSEGYQEHTLTAFWTHLLLLEVAHKLLERDVQSAYADATLMKSYNRLRALYSAHVPDDEGDFSERIMHLVNKVTDAFAAKTGASLQSKDITAMIYGGDIEPLQQALVDYLGGGTALWLLFDNIDKGWSSHGTRKEDIIILRCLVEATRKFQRYLAKYDVDCHTVLFVRKDVYDLLLDNTPDRGKESVANLDWSDTELIQELLLKRFNQDNRMQGSFEDIWSRLFDPHIAGEDSFRYILARTFLRPRDVLNFTSKSIQIAVSRSHKRVEEKDVRDAEMGFSEDMFNDLRYELRDVFPQHPDVLLKFVGWSNARLSMTEIDFILQDAKVPDVDIPKVRDALLWFSFIGVVSSDRESYSYQTFYNLAKLKGMIGDAPTDASVYVIHPAFRRALET